MEELEKNAILEALEKCGGNRTHAAAMLGLSRKTILNKLKIYGL
jgi:two-component system response regulator AtoC